MFFEKKTPENKSIPTRTKSHILYIEIIEQMTSLLYDENILAFCLLNKKLLLDLNKTQ